MDVAVAPEFTLEGPAIDPCVALAVRAVAAENVPLGQAAKRRSIEAEQGFEVLRDEIFLRHVLFLFSAARLSIVS